MKSFLSILVATVLTTLAANANSENYDLTDRWGVGAGLGVTNVASPDAFKNGVNELDGGVLASLWARYHFNSRIGMELSYSRLNFDYGGGANPAFRTLEPISDLVMVNAAYRAWPQKQLHMLLQLGLGFSRNNDLLVGGGKDDFAIGARIGGEYMATKDLALGVNADFHRINVGGGPSTHLNVISPMLSLTYYFGKNSADAATAGDSDGDGINDGLDKCANTASGTRVGADGCPLKATKNDADGDGVTDANDKCPGTLAGQKVTEYGCSPTDKIEITLNVKFETGSSKLDKRFLNDLIKFGEFMVTYKDTYVEIEGHTDNTGNEKLNYTISQRRADAVRTYLLKQHKIAKDRITAKGYGPSQPVADNAKPEGRAKNRRVVAHVQAQAPAK